MDIESQWVHLEAERRSLAALLSGLSTEQWESPSLCTRWRVRDVAAHVAMTPAGAPSTWQLVVGVARARGDLWAFGRDTAVSWGARRTTSQIVEVLDQQAASRRMPIVTNAQNLLLDAIAAGGDLGSAWNGVDGGRGRLPRVWSMGWPFHARRRLAGVTLVATDADLTVGGGPRCAAGSPTSCCSPRGGPPPPVSGWTARADLAVGRCLTDDPGDVGQGGPWRSAALAHPDPLAPHSHRAGARRRGGGGLAAVGPPPGQSTHGQHRRSAGHRAGSAAVDGDARSRAIAGDGAPPSSAMTSWRRDGRPSRSGLRDPGSGGGDGGQHRRPGRTPCAAPDRVGRAHLAAIAPAHAQPRHGHGTRRARPRDLRPTVRARTARRTPSPAQRRRHQQRTPRAPTTGTRAPRAGHRRRRRCGSGEHRRPGHAPGAGADRARRTHLTGVGPTRTQPRHRHRARRPRRGDLQPPSALVHRHVVPGDRRTAVVTSGELHAHRRPGLEHRAGHRRRRRHPPGVHRRRRSDDPRRRRGRPHPRPSAVKLTSWSRSWRSPTATLSTHQPAPPTMVSLTIRRPSSTDSPAYALRSAVARTQPSVPPASTRCPATGVLSPRRLRRISASCASAPTGERRLRPRGATVGGDERLSSRRRRRWGCRPRSRGAGRRRASSRPPGSGPAGRSSTTGRWRRRARSRARPSRGRCPRQAPAPSPRGCGRSRAGRPGAGRGTRVHAVSPDSKSSANATTVGTASTLTWYGARDAGPCRECSGLEAHPTPRVVDPPAGRRTADVRHVVIELGGRLGAGEWDTGDVAQREVVGWRSPRPVGPAWSTSSASSPHVRRQVVGLGAVVDVVREPWTAPSPDRRPRRTARSGTGRRHRSGSRPQPGSRRGRRRSRGSTAAA